MKFLQIEYCTRIRRCVPFYYDEEGLETNENVFVSKQDCQKVCPATFAPLIRLPRGNEVLAERGSSEAILHISVRANPPPTLKWFRNGRELSKFNPRYTMTENYLKISKISDFDNGTYIVRADNGIQTGTNYPK